MLQRCSKLPRSANSGALSRPASRPVLSRTRTNIKEEDWKREREGKRRNESMRFETRTLQNQQLHGAFTFFHDAANYIRTSPRIPNPVTFPHFPVCNFRRKAFPASFFSTLFCLQSTYISAQQYAGLAVARIKNSCRKANNCYRTRKIEQCW